MEGWFAVIGTVVGAVIALLGSLLADYLRDHRERKIERIRQRHQIVETYLPAVLDLLAALHWLKDDIDRREGAVQHDNPYPEPPSEVRVPGSWYGQALRLAHHPAVSKPVRGAASELVSGIERWNAIVDDLEIGAYEADSLISSTTALIDVLERYAQSATE